MKQTAHLRNQPNPFLRYSILGLVMLVIGSTGLKLLGVSLAASSYSHNPIGSADYCNLEGSNTVLYGWSHDPDAPAGPLPNVIVVIGNTSYTVPTNQAGYRDTSINDFIKNNYPGMPTSSVYGWRLSLSGLYKGTANRVSGTLLNYGTGANTVMQVNSSVSLAGGTYFTPAKTIPDACLASQPTTPSPTPSPSPSPSPTPSPTPTPPKTNPKTSPKTTPKVNPPAPTTPSSTPSDATVDIGTTTVSLKVPADNADTLHLQYGSHPTNLDQTTIDQATNGQDVPILLTGLSAKTTYTFQIIRTKGTQITPSDTATFITKGYSLSVVFTTGKNKPVPGINATLGAAKATSDKNGKLSFSGLAAGSYNPAFSYRGHTHVLTFDTYAVPADYKPVTTNLQQTVDLDKLTAVSSVKPTKTSNSSLFLFIVIGIVSVLLLSCATWFFLRLRAKRSTRIPALQSPVPLGSADIIDQQSHHHFAKHKPPAIEPTPQHLGKSLPEMVIESMRQDAARRKNQQPPP